MVATMTPTRTGRRTLDGLRDLEAGRVRDKVAVRRRTNTPSALR